MSQIGEIIGSMRDTVLGTFQFSGRSRRLELGYYWFAMTLLGVVLAVGAELLFQWNIALILKYVLWIPLFALLARRLHDQGHSGWWATLTLPLLTENLYKDARIRFHAFDPAWPDLGYWEWLMLIPLLITFGIIFAPGTIGPNRYGPDPRTEDPKP